VGEEKTAVAFHEAGHAVIGRMLQLSCGEATIVQDGDDVGGAYITNPLHQWEPGDGLRRPLVDGFCIALYAGAEAERVLLGAVDGGDETDCERATDALKQIGIPGAACIGSSCQMTTGISVLCVDGSGRNAVYGAGGADCPLGGNDPL